jgi:hypothetical protein
MGMTIGNLFGRSPKTSGAAPEKTAATKPARPGKGGGKPGTEAPEHLHEAQPESRPKMSWMDKLSGAANIAQAGAMIYPMFQSQKGEKGPNQPDPNKPMTEDMADLTKAKMIATAGQPQINW